jgi:hypothetical protein
MSMLTSLETRVPLLDKTSGVAFKNTHLKF